MNTGINKPVFPIYQLLDLIFDLNYLSGSEKLICIAFLRFHNRRTGMCFPGLTTLSECTGLTRKTLIENIKKLAQKKVIKVKKGGRRKANEYNLLFLGWLEIEPLIEPQTTPLIEPLTTPMTTPQPTKVNESKGNKEPPLPPKPKKPKKSFSGYLQEKIIDHNFIETKDKIFEFYKYRMAMPKAKQYKTEKGINGLFRNMNECRDSGLIVSECLEIAMEKGWQSFESSYYKQNNKNNSFNNSQKQDGGLEWLAMRKAARERGDIE